MKSKLIYILSGVVFIIAIILILIYFAIKPYLSLFGTSDNPKHIAVLFEQPSESRLQGGLISGVANFELVDYKIILNGYYESTEFADYFNYENKDIPMKFKPTDSESSLFKNSMTTYFANTSNSPIFSRTAELTANYIEDKTEIRPDLVIMINPYTIAEMLEITGKVKTDFLDNEIILNNENAANFLLNKIYVDYYDKVRNYDNSSSKESWEIDLDFNNYTTNIFRELLKSITNSLQNSLKMFELSKVMKIADLLKNSQNIKVYSDSKNLETNNLQTIFGKNLVFDTNSEYSTFKNKLSILTSSNYMGKMSYYADYFTELTPQNSCKINKYCYSVKVSLKNTIPEEIVNSKASYLLGSGKYPAGTLYEWVAVFLPVGGEIINNERENLQYRGLQEERLKYIDNAVFRDSFFLKYAENDSFTVTIQLNDKLEDNDINTLMSYNLH